jgi:methionyl-tRNA formyltransferase
MDGIATGALSAVPQSSDGVSYAPKLTTDDARIHWDRAAMHVDRLVRACTPAPGAWTVHGADRLKLGPVRPLGESSLAPGEVRADKHGVTVGTADRDVALSTVQAPGKRAMPAADWARGARLEAGARLG